MTSQGHSFKLTQFTSLSVQTLAWDVAQAQLVQHQNRLCDDLQTLQQVEQPVLMDATLHQRLAASLHYKKQTSYSNTKLQLRALEDKLRKNI